MKFVIIVCFSTRSLFNQWLSYGWECDGVVAGMDKGCLFPHIRRKINRNRALASNVIQCYQNFDILAHVAVVQNRQKCIK